MFNIAMGRVDKRLKELEKKQEELLSQLKGLDLEEKPAEHGEISFREVRKGILRELTDVKIRIRNLQRNRKREGSVSGKSFHLPSDCEEKCSKVEPVKAAIVKDDVDPDDDSFNPEAVELNLTRPEMRIYPKVALPHSQPAWDRVARVGRRKERAGGRLTDWHGQFTGVEEEEDHLKKMQERESRQWNWNKMNGNFSREKEYRSWREVNVEGFFSLDSGPPIVNSSWQEPPTEASTSDLIQPNNYQEGVNTAFPDIAELKKLFPLSKSPASEASPPDIQQSPPSTEQVFTKIKSRVNPDLLSRINSFLNQNTKIETNPQPTEAWKHGRSRTLKNQNSTSKKVILGDSKSGLEEHKMSRGSAPLPISSKMITVRAKLVSPPVPVPQLTVDNAAQPVREKMMRRLTKN